MAFTPTVDGTHQSPAVFGNKRVVSGTWTNAGGSTGGDINTGLAVVEQFFTQLSGASAGALAVALNKTLPVAGNAITIVTNANDTGYWMAIGY